VQISFTIPWCFQNLKKNLWRNLWCFLEQFLIIHTSLVQYSWSMRNYRGAIKRLELLRSKCTEFPTKTSREYEKVHLPRRWQSVIAARRQPAKSLILFLSSTLLRVVLDFPGINEEIFATLPHSQPAGRTTRDEKGGCASPPVPSPPPPRRGWSVG